MRYTPSIQYRPQPKRRRTFFWSTLSILITLALLLTLMAGSTFFSAYRLTHRAVLPAERISAHILPNYQNVSFRAFDDSFILRGWFVPSQSEPARGNLILVHAYGQNRLPFGSQSASLLEEISKAGFNIFLYDQRSSGESNGPQHGFGYSEWEDLLAAMESCYQQSGSSKFILMGMGTGATSILKAYQEIPSEQIKREDLRKGTEIQKRFVEYDYRQEDIKALILDAVTDHGDDQIKAQLRLQQFPLRLLLERTLPTAVRLSAGLVPNVSNTDLLSQIERPCLLIKPQKTAPLSSENLDRPANVRQNRFPSLTKIFEADNQHLFDSYWDDNQRYIQEVLSFLERWF